jgi:hypothetical protein
VDSQIFSIKKPNVERGVAKRKTLTVESLNQNDVFAKFKCDSREEEKSGYHFRKVWGPVLAIVYPPLTLVQLRCWQTIPSWGKRNLDADGMETAARRRRLLKAARGGNGVD